MSQIDILRQRRLKQTNRSGSPLFTYSQGALAASSYNTVVVETQFPAAQKYAPLDFLEIANSDVVDLQVYLNGRSEQVYVPAGTIRSLHKAITEFTVLNLNATTAVTAGAVIITLQKEPMTADKEAQERS